MNELYGHVYHYYEWQITASPYYIFSAFISTLSNSYQLLNMLMEKRDINQQ